MNLKEEAANTNWVALVLLVLIVGGLAFGIYWWQKQTTVDMTPIEITPTTTTTATTTSTATPTETEDETAGWKTYTDKTWGFSIKCPSDWVLAENTEEDTTQSAFYTAKNYRLEKENKKNCAAGNSKCISDGYPAEVTFGESSNRPGSENAKKIVINGVTFTKYVTQGMAGNYEIYQIQGTNDHKGMEFSAVQGTEAASILPKMLATFKYTD